MPHTKASRDIFAQSKTDWLDKARHTARKLLETRSSITSENVTALCPLPKYLHVNLIGNLFKHPDFVAIGYSLAKRPTSNGRLIRLWALKHPPEPRRWKTPVEAEDVA